MKKMLLFALAGVALASCSDDEFVGNPVARSAGEITFAQSVPNLTRSETTGAEAAAKLNNQFVVYGYKNATGQNEDTGTGANANDQVVFNNYKVTYGANTAHSTQSNSDNWEYVGNKSVSNETQTIKYWDFSTERYVFSAISGVNLTLTKIMNATNAQDKGWYVTVPAGGSISDLYASNRRVISKSKKNGESTTSFETVKLTFYSLITKVRFGIYETVPGYSVTIDKFYYTNGSELNTTDFALDGSFKKQDNSKDLTFKVTYANTDDKAKPVCTPQDDSFVETAYGTFGSNIKDKTLGTASNEATYDQANGDYNIILPYEKANNVLKLKIDYTLTSTDAAKEKIHVYGATAYVPAQYTQWQNSYAYTYLFKISDNTNGKTSTGDDDPEGLYPITFDAVVVADADGVQETITSVAKPSITTYKDGAIVTNNNEYTPGTIYYSAMTDGALMDISGSHVYEIYNNASNHELTEKYVAAYETNELVLIDVPTTDASTVTPLVFPGASFSAKQCYSFQAEAGRTYAIKCVDGWKIVKVTGSSTPTFAFKLTSSSDEIKTVGGQVEYSLSTEMTDNSTTPPTVTNGKVLDATSLIKVYNSSDTDVTDQFYINDITGGKYTIKPTDAFIASGANGSYYVKFDGNKAQTAFTIKLPYTLTPVPATVTIAAGNTTGATVQAYADGRPAYGTVVNNNAKINVTPLAAAGSYQITADADCPYVNGGYTLTIGGETLTVNVDSYTLSASVAEINKAAEGTNTLTVTLTKNGGTATGINYENLTGYNNSIATATGSDGAFTLTPVAGGVLNLSYANASCTVTVNEYTLTPTTATVAKGGSTTLTLTKNDGSDSPVNIEAAKVSILDKNGNTTDKVAVADGGLLSVESDADDTLSPYTVKYTIGGVVVATSTITVQ